MQELEEAMSELIGMLFEILPARLLIFVLGLGVIGIGIYGCNTIRENNRPYNAAVGEEGRIVDAQVVSKREATEAAPRDSDQIFVTVHYLDLSYEVDGQTFRKDVSVDGDEYRSVKENDTIKVRLHPSDPKYVVTPKMAKPSGIFAWIGCIIAFLLGLFMVLAIIISMF
jgi:hypothetical protein